MWSRDMQKEALLSPPLTMATGNSVNLEKTSEMSPIKDEFLASFSEQNFDRKLKKSAFKLSKVQRFSYSSSHLMVTWFMMKPIMHLWIKDLESVEINIF